MEKTLISRKKKRIRKKIKINPNSSNNALVIFVKNPELGKAKTRLAATIGNHNALIIYKRLLEITRKESRGVDAQKYLFFHEKIIENKWSKNDFEFVVQSNGDLGQKMKASLHLVLEQHDKAIIIGSDCPNITKELINDAFLQLNQYDYVIGPSKDGGYYLLGLTSIEVDIFSNILWSTDQVFSTTMNRLNAAGVTTKLLPELNDIDCLEDLKKYPCLYEDLNLNYSSDI